MKCKKKVIIISVCMCIIIMVCIVNAILKKRPYEEYYFETIGIDRIGYTYGNMISDFGEPVEIKIREDGWTTAVYNDFSIDYAYKENSAFVANVKVFSNKYKFGRRKIGIGSTKEEVAKAYKNAFSSPDGPYRYLDNRVYIQFSFDGNDQVKEIMFLDYNHL